MERLVGNSCSNCAVPVALPDAAPCSFPTMRPIIILESTSPGGRSMPAALIWTFCPRYSPELNPIERVWKLTRRLCLHNRYFQHLNGVITAVENEFAKWTRRNEVLRRLCAIT